MKAVRYIRNGWAVLLVLLLSCSKVYRPAGVAYEGYAVSGTRVDSALLVLTAPYRDSVERSMNEVVGTATHTLEKKQPEGTLGNFMADAMLHMGRRKFGAADAAFVNYGGIRLTQLPAGPVTRGKIFELMPFDNLLILQELKGSVLQEFLDLTAARGGWPVAGLSLQIRDGKAVNVTVGGQPLDPAKTYRIINSDYIATGGDNAVMLKVLPYRNIGYLIRDALFEYIQVLKAEGRPISATEEKRITHAS